MDHERVLGEIVAWALGEANVRLAVLTGVIGGGWTLLPTRVDPAARLACADLPSLETTLVGEGPERRRLDRVDGSERDQEARRGHEQVGGRSICHAKSTSWPVSYSRQIR